MKKCVYCGEMIADDNARFCLACGKECSAPATMSVKRKDGDKEADVASLVGDKNVINESTIIGKQDKYEASNITINNTTIEDHSHTTVVCAVSGKRVYMDSSVVCPQCGKTVATEYYNEASRRCELCEKSAREAFKGFATQLLNGRSLDGATMSTLEAKAREFVIDASTQRDILREVQSASNDRNVVLSAVQQAELTSATERLMSATSNEECKSALSMFEALHNMSKNYTVEFWYYLSRAVADPKGYIAEYEDEVTDNYWQRYWGFLAYTITSNSKSIVAIEYLRKNFGDREDDILLAESVYFIARGFETQDPKMLSMAGEKLRQIKPDYLSKPLMFIYNVLARLTKEGLRLDVPYNAEEQFTILNIFRAGRVIKGMREEEQAERERVAREEAERERREQEARAKAAREEKERAEKAERERREREAARRAQEAAVISEHKNRMEQEKARMSGGKPKADDKAFAGYETAIPKKKSKAGRIALIVLAVLVLAVAVLFIIPAPESMQ